MNSDRIYGVLVPLIRPVVVGRIGARRRKHFEAMPEPTDRVVFLGDSITEQGFWEDLFPELPTTNRGIGGEATYDVLERLDSAIVAPRAVSLLIGTNDLHGPRDRRDLAGIADRVDELVGAIRHRAPAAPLFLNSVLPRTSLFAPRITSLNQRYRKIATDHGATFVDLWPTFADPAGALKKDFTVDNLHLTPAGYLAWADVLRPHLASLESQPARPH